MKIVIEKVYKKRLGKYSADMPHRPGSPLLGFGATKVAAVADLFAIVLQDDAEVKHCQEELIKDPLIVIEDKK